MTAQKIRESIAMYRGLVTDYSAAKGDRELRHWLAIARDQRENYRIDSTGKRNAALMQRYQNWAIALDDKIANAVERLESNVIQLFF